MSVSPPACPVCNTSCRFLFEARLLGRHDAAFFRCPGCGLVRTESPYWLADAYSSAIASTDVGILMRNLGVARKLAAFLYFVLGLRDSRQTCLDLAGGYGVLVRLMRDFGFDFYWQDRYCQNLFATAYTGSPEKKPAAVVTAIEAMEHLEDPALFVSQALENSGAGCFVFTTELIPDDEAPLADWWYYSLETGQHITFFTRKSLRLLAESLGMRFYSYGGLHVLSARPLNEFVFGLVCGRAHRMAAYLVERRMMPLTAQDHRRAVMALQQAPVAIEVSDRV